MDASLVASVDAPAIRREVLPSTTSSKRGNVSHRIESRDDRIEVIDQRNTADVCASVGTFGSRKDHSSQQGALVEGKTSLILVARVAAVGLQAAELQPLPCRH